MSYNRQISAIILAVLVILCIPVGQMITSSPDVTVALMVGGLVALAGFGGVSYMDGDRQFMKRLWLIAIGARLLVAFGSYYFDLRSMIAGDYDTYDALGDTLYQSWIGLVDPNTPRLISFTSWKRSGWGIYYFVAALYYLIGRNSFAFQLICCALGAGVAILIYRIALFVYPQPRVARLAGMMTALSPSMIIWTSQGLKEGPITFLLCVILFMTLRLSLKIRLLEFVILMVSLFCLFSLRHYVFYVVFMSVTGALLIAARDISPFRIIQGGILIIVLGFGFVSLGARDIAEQNFDLKRIQAGREWSARVSNTGYGGDVDITDTRQAIAYVPIGAAYFLYAPFPWMISSTMQVLTLPELILWWLMAPLLLLGYWYGIRYRIRPSFALRIFTLALTLVYALYQTNAGTAHRQRVQLLGFFIIFISIGWERWRASNLEKRMANNNRSQRWTRLPQHRTD